MNKYENPLIEKYSSEEMSYNFSPKKKFTTWRKLWISLAENQKKLGINISEEQIKDLKDHINNIDFDQIKFFENKFHHDVIAHIYAYGKLAKIGKPILHLGVTSAFIVDNTDLIQIRDGLKIILKKILLLIISLKKFIQKNKNLPTLAFTHYQPALLTTVGKRGSLWLYSLILDLEELEFRLYNLKFRGVKGAVGTGNSFKKLFKGDFSKLKILEKNIANDFGFKNIFTITSQIYDRKIDSQILQLMSNISQSAHKFTNDIRLLQNIKELEEPFEHNQFGSSAMPYKKNPILSERISSLSKYIIAISNSTSMVAAGQWLERTLDDSANKRISIAQSFLATDAILLIWNKIINGIKIFPKIIEKNIKKEIPFIITEDIIMNNVENGGNRQEIHKKIRDHSIKCIDNIKNKGKDNDLIDRILNDKSINISKEEINNFIKLENLTGFAIEQIMEFIKNEVDPIINKYNY